MDLFEKRLESYLTLYKIPLGPNQLDPTVFYFSETGDLPRLLPSIITQISRDIEFIVDGQPSRVENYYLVGPALKPGNKNRSGELKVLVIINKKIMDVDVDGLSAEQLLRVAKRVSGKLATGTTRPINYTISVRDIEKDNYEGIYNLFTNEWVKIPNGLNK